MRRRNSFWPTCGLGLALSLAVLQVGEIAVEAQRARPAAGSSAGESPDPRPPIDPPANTAPSPTSAAPGHPKVWLLASEVPAVRTYITTYQKAPFEAWLARLDAGVDATCAAALKCKGADAGWMAANLALLHTIGESWVAATRSITKPAGFADFDTGAEVCALAYSYLLKTNAANRGPVGTSIKAIFDAVVDRATANKASDELHAMTGSTSGSWWYGVLPLVYDHCHDSLTPAQRAALEASISNFATAACSTLPEWPQRAIAPGIGANSFVLGNRGPTGALFTASLTMYGAVGQGVLTPAVEGYITECIRKIWVNQVFAELRELFTRRGVGALLEARIEHGYASDALMGLIMTAQLGRTIPAFAKAAAPLQIFMESMPTYFMNAMIPEPIVNTAAPGDARQWLLSWGTTGDQYFHLTGGAATYARIIPGLLGVCRSWGWTCAGKFRWIMDQLYGAGGYDAVLDNSNVVESSSLVWRFLGGWGGVKPVDATPATAEAGNDHFTFRDWTDPKSGLINFAAQEQDGGGHNNGSGHFGQDFGTFDIWKHGFLALHTAWGGKGNFGDDPLVLGVNQSRIQIWKNDDVSNGNIAGGGGPNRSLVSGVELAGEEDPAWEARLPAMNHEKAGKIFAATPDDPNFGCVGVDYSSNFNTTIVGTNGFAQGWLQRDFCTFKGLDFVVVLDKTKVLTPATYKRSFRIVTPSRPTFDGTTTHPFAGYWQSTDSTYAVIENISGPPGSGVWTAIDQDRGKSGPWPRSHGRMFVIPVTATGSAYDKMVARGYDPAFTNAALRYDSNLTFQHAGETTRPTAVEWDWAGTAAAHTSGAQSCVIQLTDSPVLHESQVALSLASSPAIYTAMVSGRDNDAKTVTIAGGTCPTIGAGAPVDYVLWRNRTEKRYAFGDPGAQRILGWGRLDIPKWKSSTGREDFMVALHYGDSDTFSKPTTVTPLSDDDQQGLQAHGAGVEVVFMAATAVVDIGTSLFDRVPTGSFPLSDFKYTFNCYPGATIKHLARHVQPAATYQVVVTGSAPSCTATVTKTGGSRTVGQGGDLYFTTTDTTVK